MSISTISPATRLIAGVSLSVLITLLILTFTRFGAFVVFDLFDGPDNFTTTYQDAPISITHQLTSPQLIEVPTEIAQVSGIYVDDQEIVVSTDQAELFRLDADSPQEFSGGNLFRWTPLILRQGSLESVTKSHGSYQLVGEYGAILRAGTDLRAIGDLPLPDPISSYEYSGITFDSGKYYLTWDGSSNVLIFDATSETFEQITLNFDDHGGPENVENAFLWSGLDVQDGVLYLVAQNYPIVVAADVSSGTVTAVFGIEGQQEFADIAVNGPHIYLPSDHNLFAPRPPIRAFSLDEAHPVTR